MSTDLYSTSFSGIGLIVFWISCAVILLYWFSSAFSFALRREIVRRQQVILLTAFFVSLCVWAFLWDPAPYYDSYQHFLWMNRIRNENIPFWTFMTKGFSGNTTGSYTDLIVFNLLRYSIVSISNDNHLLPLVCAAIDFLIIYYIVTDYFKDNQISYAWLFPYSLLCFSFLPYFMIVSGIRNALAATIAAFLLYQRLYKNRGIVFYVVGSLLVATIHPNVLLPLVIGLTYSFFKGAKGILLIALTALFLTFGVDLLQNASVSFLSYLGNMISYYLNEGKYEGEMITYVVDIIVSVCILLLMHLNRNVIQPNSDKTLQFCQVYAVVMLLTAFIGGTNFLTRSGYAFGPLAVFLIRPFSRLDFSAKRLRGLLNGGLLCVMLLACIINIADSFWLLLAQFF